MPAGNASALAGAIDELLDLPVEERAAMGRRGREFVLERFDLRRQAARLSALIEDAAESTGAR